MAPTRLRRLVTLLGFLVLVAAFAAAGTGPERAVAHEVEPRSAFAAAPAIPLGVLDASAQAAIEWRGGTVTVSTGEVLRVFVSASLPLEVEAPETWAELIVGFTHGPELGLLTSFLAPLEEVQEICGARTLGCYARNQMIAPVEIPFDGTTAEEVLRHEYGHHVALHRLNPPWAAIDWGPKHWASAANVCRRAGASQAFPGDGGQNYALNPGEAWAEAYRLMDERRAGITTATWPIVSPSFFPDEGALQAAERDVLQPWTKPSVRSFQRTFARPAQVWWIPLSTPLDGTLRLTAAVPRGGTHEVALVAANRRTVVRRGQWVGQRSQSLATTVCGQRSLFVRVTQRGALGPVRVSVTTS